LPIIEPPLVEIALFPNVFVVTKELMLTYKKYAPLNTFVPPQPWKKYLISVFVLSLDLFVRENRTMLTYKKYASFSSPAVPLYWRKIPNF
jgi:hypothetical protein